MSETTAQTPQDDFYCRLLAWLLYHGIHTEEVIFNRRLNIDIRIAKERLKIEAGKIPDAELLPLLNHYMSECNGNRPDWVVKLEKSYGIKIRHGNKRTNK